VAFASRYLPIGAHCVRCPFPLPFFPSPAVLPTTPRALLHVLQLLPTSLFPNHPPSPTASPEGLRPQPVEVLPPNQVRRTRSSLICATLNVHPPPLLSPSRFFPINVCPPAHFRRLLDISNNHNLPVLTSQLPFSRVEIPTAYCLPDLA